ncbi:MAG TPA: zinc-ribbon domain-containing protein, partial [Chloroflexota bacterium]|nr:zinc-ribbon domain-containing protein [Chloroflexota bacterium]
MSYQDKALTCADCGTQFVFTANEQAFYAERGFTNEPKRCGPCRQNRKASRGGGGYSSYGSNGGDAYSSEGGYSSGGYGGGQREMHTVTCSACGGEAKVP